MLAEEYLDMLVMSKEIKKNVQNNQKAFDLIRKFILTTDTYKECQYLYDFFVGEVATYLREQGIDSSEDAVIYLDLMLRNGLLSATGENKYHLYKYDFDYVSELMGARTIGGISVCRHMSSLISDILNMEYYATWLNAKYITSTSDINNDTAPYLHAVVGVLSNDKKLIYDPTASSFAAKPLNKEIANTGAERVAETFISFSQFAEKGDLILLNSQQYLINPDNYQELVAVWNAPLIEKNEEFDEHIRKSSELFEKTKENAYAFKKSIKDIVQRIVELETKMHPHSDTPILEWKIKK